MILIDQPYVSDFLIQTIKKNQFPVVATSVAKKMIGDNLIHWISEQQAIDFYKKNEAAKLYSNSENAIEWIEKNLGFSKLPTTIQLFKNKVAFRHLIKDSYPNYFFKEIAFNQLKEFKANHLKFPLILKPAVGFFSLAVYKIDNLLEWQDCIASIENDIEIFKDLYPKEVVNSSQFILEEYIEGNEFAVDCYFNSEGKAIVLNILHHSFSSSKDVSDRVYSTSKEIIETYLQKFTEFLQIIGNKAQLKNFPLHAEVRVNANDELIPIEINPLRFGGWCTTADLAYYAFGFNSYEYFLQNKTPDWKAIFKNNAHNIFSLIVLDNNSGIANTLIKSFNYNALLKDFENPLHLRKVAYKKYGVFGFLFTKTQEKNKQELTNILTSTLTKYIHI